MDPSLLLVDDETVISDDLQHVANNKRARTTDVSATFVRSRISPGPNTGDDLTVEVTGWIGVSPAVDQKRERDVEVTL